MEAASALGGVPRMSMCRVEVLVVGGGEGVIKDRYCEGPASRSISHPAPSTLPSSRRKLTSAHFRNPAWPCSPAAG